MFIYQSGLLSYSQMQKIRSSCYGSVLPVPRSRVHHRHAIWNDKEETKENLLNVWNTWNSANRQRSTLQLFNVRCVRQRIRFLPQTNNTAPHINKIITIGKQDGADHEEATYDTLQAYRSTLHPARKLPSYQTVDESRSEGEVGQFPNRDLRERHSCKNKWVARYNKKGKEYRDKRHKTTTHKMKPGDAVVVKWQNKRKAQTVNEPCV